MMEVIVEHTSRTVPAIDAHAHYVPQAYRQGLTDAGLLKSDIFPLAPWELEKHVEDMDMMNIGAAVVSLSSPDAHWGDSKKACELARNANEVAATAVQKYPKRFGFMATVPAPDIDACLEEIEYAFDVLHADGVKFYSNNNGVYLGDPVLDPVFEELGRRKAVVTLHPTKPKHFPPDVLKGVPYPLFEFFFETTRAVANMMFNGTLKRHPGIKFLVPHWGALFPILGGRMNGIAQLMVQLKIAEEGWVPPDFSSEFQSFYFDGAGGFNLPMQIPALKTLSTPKKWMAATDYPFTPATMGRQQIENLRSTDLLTEQERMGILRNNALELFPSLA
jgi:predicted TIM-barrel fold metal-dependent hydrolase